MGKKNHQVQCLYCSFTFWVTSSTRIRSHLISNPKGGVRGCDQVPDKVKADFQAQIAAKEQDKASKKRSTDLAMLAASSNRVKTQQPDIQFAMRKGDKLTVKCFVANGLPFNVIKNKYFIAMLAEVGKYGGAYKPPGIDKLSTTLLDQQKEFLKGKLASLHEFRKGIGNVLTSDGWTSVSSKPLLNFLSVTPFGAEFICAKDITGATKDAHYLAGTLKETLLKLEDDAQQVVAIVTDSASACKAAGALIEAEFNHITWVPCSAHILDLLLEDIGKEPWAAQCVKMGRWLVSFINNHHKSRNIFVRYSDLVLLQPKDTQFGTAYMCLERLMECHKATEKTVTDEAWDQWVRSTPSICNKAEQAKYLTYNDVWWRIVEQLVAIYKPIYEFLRCLDGDTPNMGIVYSRALKVGQQLEALDCLLEEQKTKVLSLFAACRQQMLSRLHYVGHILNPQFHKESTCNDKAMTESLADIVERLLPDPQDQTSFFNQHIYYRHAEGIFLKQVVWNCAKTMAAWKWWEQWGADCPQLQKMAMKILSLVSTASACERNWSTFDFIHYKRKNCLTADRANDLVYCFNNLRLLDKNSNKAFEEEEIPEWESDVDEDIPSLSEMS